MRSKEQCRYFRITCMRSKEQCRYTRMTCMCSKEQAITTAITKRPTWAFHSYQTFYLRMKSDMYIGTSYQTFYLSMKSDQFLWMSHQRHNLQTGLHLLTPAPFPSLPSITWLIPHNFFLLESSVCLFCLLFCVFFLFCLSLPYVKHLWVPRKALYKFKVLLL